jgi:hypothetical protein
MGDIDAIVVEPGFLGEGYVEAVRRRNNGRFFYGMLLLEEIHDRTMTQLVPAVLQQPGGPDRHREILYSVQGGGIQMDGKSVAEALAEAALPDPNARAAAKEFLTLCPAMLVRSSAEYQRLSEYSVRRRPYELFVAEPPVPVVERRPHERPGFVIWAAERDANAALLPVFALSELHGDVTLVSADGVVPNGANVAAYTPGDPRVAEALATADVIVLTDATDPGAAIAFARAGYGIVAPVRARRVRLRSGGIPRDARRGDDGACVAGIAARTAARSAACTAASVLAGERCGRTAAGDPGHSDLQPARGSGQLSAVPCRADLSERAGRRRQRCRRTG